MFSNKNKKIFYLVVASALLISFAWLYILKLNIKNMNEPNTTNGIGISEFKTRFNEIMKKSPLINPPKKQGEEITTNDIAKKLAAELKLQETDTSDWKTYTNEEYGFEFKYPTDWTEKTTTNDYIILTPKNDKNNFDIIKIQIDKTFDLQAFIKSSETQLKTEKIVMGIDNYEAIEVQNLGLVTSKDVYLEKNQYIYSFVINEESSQVENFYKILSTFKLTEEGEVKGAKTKTINTLPEL